MPAEDRRGNHPRLQLLHQISPLTRWPGVEVRLSLSPERSLAYKGSIQCQLIPSWEPLKDATAVIIIPTWAQLEDRAVLLPAAGRGGNHPRRQLRPRLQLRYQARPLELDFTMLKPMLYNSKK